MGGICVCVDRLEQVICAQSRVAQVPCVPYPRLLSEGEQVNTCSAIKREKAEEEEEEDEDTRHFSLLQRTGNPTNTRRTR